MQRPQPSNGEPGDIYRLLAGLMDDALNPGHVWDTCASTLAGSCRHLRCKTADASREPASYQ